MPRMIVCGGDLKRFFGCAGWCASGIADPRKAKARFAGERLMDSKEKQTTGLHLTRREALQGIAGAAAASLVAGKSWAEGARQLDANEPGRADGLQAFNSDWRFRRGD